MACRGGIEIYRSILQLYRSKRLRKGPLGTLSTRCRFRKRLNMRTSHPRGSKRVANQIFSKNSTRKPLQRKITMEKRLVCCNPWSKRPVTHGNSSERLDSNARSTSKRKKYKGWTKICSRIARVRLRLPSLGTRSQLCKRNSKNELSRSWKIKSSLSSYSSSEKFTKMRQFFVIKCLIGFTRGNRAKEKRHSKSTL